MFIFIKKYDFFEVWYFKWYCSCWWVIVNRRFEVFIVYFRTCICIDTCVIFFKRKPRYSFFKKVFRNSIWFEREAWDMFGVSFFIILIASNFNRLWIWRFPLRKDFPLTGYLEVRFDDETSSWCMSQLNCSRI